MNEPLLKVKMTSMPAVRNVIVAVMACALSYLVVTGAFLIEFSLTASGQLVRTGSEVRPTEETGGAVDVFAAMKGWLNRMRFVYIPLALALPALLVSMAAYGWGWSWLVTLVGCAPGLVILAITTDDNLGVGILVAAVVYFVIAGAVTWWRYANRNSPSATNASLREAVTPEASGSSDSDRSASP